MKKFILVDARKGVIFQVVKEIEVVYKHSYCLVNGYKYSRESYSYLDIYETKEVAIKKAKKRNSELIKQLAITKDNIAEYYEFMSDDDLDKYSLIISTFFNTDRFYSILKSILGINRPRPVLSLKDKEKMKLHIEDVYANTTQIKKIGMFWFNVKDTLKPIDEYIAEIKDSKEYKLFILRELLKKEKENDNLSSEIEEIENEIIKLIEP